MPSKSAKRVLIAFDNDNARSHAADEAAKRFIAIGIDAFRVKFPSGQDANEYASKLKMALDKGEPGHASLGLAIRNADWIANGNKTEPAITTITPNFLQQARDNISAEESRNALAR